MTHDPQCPVTDDGLCYCDLIRKIRRESRNVAIQRCISVVERTNMLDHITVHMRFMLEEP